MSNNIDFIESEVLVIHSRPVLLKSESVPVIVCNAHQYAQISNSNIRGVDTRRFIFRDEYKWEHSYEPTFKEISDIIFKNNIDADGFLGIRDTLETFTKIEKRQAVGIPISAEAIYRATRVFSHNASKTYTQILNELFFDYGALHKQNMQFSELYMTNGYMFLYPTMKSILVESIDLYNSEQVLSEAYKQAMDNKIELISQLASIEWRIRSLSY